jgi:hypothetical protein
MKKTDHRRCRLLCARRERPSRRSADKSPDELAPLYSHPISPRRLNTLEGYG